jgi:hypothetical protein
LAFDIFESVLMFLATNMVKYRWRKL